MKINTDRAFIIPFEQSHIPDILEMLLEPDSNQFIQPLHGKSKEQLEERLFNNLYKNQKELQFFSAFDCIDNKFIGTLNLNDFECTCLKQLGVHLKKAYWNQGFAYELCKELLDYSVELLNNRDVHWIYEEGHEASKKLALKLGFVPFTTMQEGNIQLNVYKIR